MEKQGMEKDGGPLVTSVRDCCRSTRVRETGEAQLDEAVVLSKVESTGASETLGGHGVGEEDAQETSGMDGAQPKRIGGNGG